MSGSRAGPSTSKVWFVTGSSRGLGRALAASGLDRDGEPRLRFHDLRHTFASLLIAEGLNIMFVSRQLGHASPSFTLDTYGGLFDAAEHQRRATDALEASFAGTLASCQLSAPALTTDSHGDDTAVDR